MLKLCGMRRREDISYVNEFPPDLIGMILTPGFKRSIDVAYAAELLSELDGRIKKVGVFVDEPISAVKAAAERLRLDVLQLHGNEDTEYIRSVRMAGIEVWKAVRVKSLEDIARADSLGCDCLLLDSFVKGAVGGTGVKADWELIKAAAPHTPFFLAGGINEDNLAQAMKISQNIDISGGIEENGAKDREKLRRIVQAYRKGELA